MNVTALALDIACPLCGVPSDTHCTGGVHYAHDARRRAVTKRTLKQFKRGDRVRLTGGTRNGDVVTVRCVTQDGERLLVSHPVSGLWSITLDEFEPLGAVDYLGHIDL